MHFQQWHAYICPVVPFLEDLQQADVQRAHTTMQLNRRAIDACCYNVCVFFAILFTTLVLLSILLRALQHSGFIAVVWLGAGAA